MDFDAERILRNPFFAGAAGALVALKGAPGATWPERLFNVICGALVAWFGAPAVAEWLGAGTAAMQSGIAFGCGLFAMNIVAKVVEIIRGLSLADVLPWTKKGP